MKDRIKQFIDYKGISPGDLASALDVQRSNISHILNGRNKPGAAFIEKMLLEYPELNARWLLTGTGNMITVGSETNALETSSEPVITGPKKEVTENESRKNAVDEAKTIKGMNNEGIDKVVLLFTDGTFSAYNHK